MAGRSRVLRDRLQEPAPVPERDSRFVEILLRQVRLNIEVDVARFEGVGESTCFCVTSREARSCRLALSALRFQTVSSVARQKLIGETRP